ncbi:MAG: hypothetical protein AAFU85_20515 [Planctomycetota bacterium]
MESSLTLQSSFVILPLLLVAVAWWLCRSTRFLVGAVSFLLASALLALSGVLSDFEALPPRLLLLLLPLTVIVSVSAFRTVGDRFMEMSWAWIVGFQAFRFPLELMIRQAVEEGVAPPQFTWTGLNWDILSGILSLLLLPFAARAPKWLLWAWNVIGLALLLNIVVVAIISVPGPLQRIQPDNTWVAYFPFVWLPAICVMAALMGHLVAFRKLRRADLRR